MARPLRIEYDGAVYHITSRGNARKAIYKDDNDQKNFLDILHQVNRRYNWLCHAYCLMNNHYHLVIETVDGNLSKGMRQLNGVYTQAFNRRHGKTGHVFQGRYKSILIQKDSHLLEVCRYVVLNPVRAKTVEKPEQWKWSSYRATSAKSSPHACLKTDWVLRQFGKRKRQAIKEYRKFVEAGIAGKKIWNDVQGQSILGEDGFVEGLLDYVKGYKEIQEIPKAQRYIDRPTLIDIFSKKVVSDKNKRNAKIIEAIEKHAYSQREIARFLGMHYASISRLARKE